MDLYGTIGRMTVKPGHMEAVTALGLRWVEERAPAVPGFVDEVILYPDDRPDECLLVVLFDSEASYRANAASPEQDRIYQEFRSHLTTDPEWTDGRIRCLTSSVAAR